MAGIFACIDADQYGECLEITEGRNFQVMDIVAEAGSIFAFPFQISYLESRAERNKDLVSLLNDRDFALSFSLIHLHIVCQSLHRKVG